MIGTTIGSYAITKLLGTGGMGQVYLAHHTLLGRPAAVKVLLPAFSHDQATVTRFFNEARAATAIAHLGIVEIYDFGFHVDRSAYIAMELLAGESLAARLQRGPFSAATALTICRQIAGVLVAAHASGIVHRDLKPDNIFLVPDPELPTGERVKLLDFGIAKLALAPENARGTRPGAIMGTPDYMAPEQCRGLEVDDRADLYALGCILFEMLTGRTPFVGEGVGDVLVAQVCLPAPAASSLVTGVSPSTEALLGRLLAKDPDARPQRAAEVIAAIDGTAEVTADRHAASSRSPSSPGPAGPPTTLGGSASGWDHRRTSPGRGARRLAAGSLAVLATLATVVAVDRRAPGHDAATPPMASATPPMASATPPPAASPAAPTETAPVPPIDTLPAPPVLPATVTVAIDSKPSGAVVLLDGAAVGNTPYRGSLAHGPTAVLVVLRRDGYQDTELTMIPDGPISETVVLSKRKKAGPPPTDSPATGSTNPFSPSRRVHSPAAPP